MFCSYHFRAKIPSVNITTNNEHLILTNLIYSTLFGQLACFQKVNGHVLSVTNTENPMDVGYKINSLDALSSTATFTINCHLCCLWSKIGTFQFGIELCKRATLPILNWMFKNTIESFQMRYCMQFFLQGHQNCQNLKIYTSEFT